MTFYYPVIILSNCLLLVAFLFAISNKQRSKDKDLRWYAIYLGFILTIEIITNSLIFIFDTSNTQSVYPLYVAGEFFILTKLFSTVLNFPKRWHTITIFIAISIFIEATILWSLNGDASTGYGKIFSHLTIICLSGYLLIKNLKELESYDPLITIYAALFLYYAVSLFLFLLMDQLTKANIVIWTMNNILSSILYGSSIYTFYELKKSLNTTESNFTK